MNLSLLNDRAYYRIMEYWGMCMLWINWFDVDIIHIYDDTIGNSEKKTADEISAEH